MDSSPRQRLYEPAAYFREDIIDVYGRFMADLPQPIIDLFEYTYWVWYFTQNEKYEEMMGFVEAVASPDLTMGKCVLVNALYELESWCTSIIVQQTDGKIIHARNLDFDNPDGMRKITFRANFVRNGTNVYNAVMFAGNAGVYTGMKKGAFSISENQRFPQKDEKGLVENILMMFTGYKEISWVVRETLNKCEDYDCAYEHLKNTEINALGYIILAGTKENEGVVISRNRIGAAHEDHLNVTNGTWYVVQTNSDHWDQGCFNRCESAHTNLDKLGQDALDITVLREKVLKVFPNQNYDTLYNTQFVPSDGLIDTISLKYAGDQ